MASGISRPFSEVWTGIVHKRRKVRAVKVSWAYAPGLVRVRSTADGRHWETVGASARTGSPDLPLLSAMKGRSVPQIHGLGHSIES